MEPLMTLITLAAVMFFVFMAAYLITGSVENKAILYPQGREISYNSLQRTIEEEEMTHYDNERENDLVNNPKHYQLFADGTEAIEIIQATLSREEFMGYLKGNALKYRLRAGEKGDLQQDIDKANWYKNKLSEFLG